MDPRLSKYSPSSPFPPTQKGSIVAPVIPAAGLFSLPAKAPPRWVFIVNSCWVVSDRESANFGPPLPQQFPISRISAVSFSPKEKIKFLQRVLVMKLKKNE